MVGKDKINPEHYKKEGKEVIDIIKETLSRDAFLGFLSGNVIKYLGRYKEKNGVEDLNKAKWYLDRLIIEEKGGPSK